MGSSPTRCLLRCLRVWVHACVVLFVFVALTLQECPAQLHKGAKCKTFSKSWASFSRFSNPVSGIFSWLQIHKQELNWFHLIFFEPPHQNQLLQKNPTFFLASTLASCHEKPVLDFFFYKMKRINMFFILIIIFRGPYKMFTRARFGPQALSLTQGLQLWGHMWLFSPDPAAL